MRVWLDASVRVPDRAHHVARRPRVFGHVQTTRHQLHGRFGAGIDLGVGERGVFRGPTLKASVVSAVKPHVAKHSAVVSSIKSWMPPKSPPRNPLVGVPHDEIGLPIVASTNAATSVSRPNPLINVLNRVDSPNSVWACQIQARSKHVPLRPCRLKAKPCLVSGVLRKFKSLECQRLGQVQAFLRHHTMAGWRSGGQFISRRPKTVRW